MTLQPLPEYEHAFERSFPTPDAARNIYQEQEFHRAVEAYRFFYPTVSMEALFEGLRDALVEDGAALGLLTATPRHALFTASSDAPHAIGVLDLEKMGPVVVELPPGPYLGAIDDHHQRWITDLGLNGPDGGAGGKYLVLPQGYAADVPEGHHLASSTTHKLLLLIRALPEAGDMVRALHALRQVRVYPMRDPEAVLQFVDISERELAATPVQWENNLEYWERLHEVVDSEPLLEQLRTMYGQLAVLGIERNRPFSPTSRQRRILEAAARAGIDELRVEGFDSQRLDRLIWNDRQWEWIALVPNDANFETEGFLDLEARDRWFFQAAIASPALFQRQAGPGSLCFASSRDQDGAHLDGGGLYKLVLPEPVPAQRFWSVTAYDAKTRSQVRTAQNKAVLSSARDRLELSSDGSLELYFGPEPPPGGAHNWLQTPAEDGFFLYLRVYGPEAACLDGRWRPSDLIRLDRRSAPPAAARRSSRPSLPPAAPAPRLARDDKLAPVERVKRLPVTSASSAASIPSSPAPESSLELAARRTSMAFQRTRLSADRTLLSLIVASISLIGFGYAIFQIFQELGDAQLHAGASNFGATLVWLGVLLLLLGSAQHLWFLRELRLTRRELTRAGLTPSWSRVPPSLTLIAVALLLALGITAIVSMLANAGPFS